MPATDRNLLADATSPYLRQHAANPVEWWPWCDEAFAEARERDVPVLVSATLGELERRDETGIGASNIRQLRVIHPFDAPGRRLERMVFNLGGWMSGRRLKLARDTERLQGDTWSACAVTARALYTLDATPSREGLLERVEDAYAGATTTAYPRFTLGPGQRYGSKGAYVMRISADDRLEVEGEWVVP